MAGKPDINRASREELMQAEGIGEELADRIIQHRPYHSEKDLDRLFQVGDTRLDQVREAVSIPGGGGGQSGGGGERGR